jgi:hypothetical protein
MAAFWTKYKGYIIHTAAVAVLFLSPSVQSFAEHNTAYAAAILAAWGYALHWATGK